MKTSKGIPIANLYYLLAYAYELVDKNLLTDVAAEQFDSPLNLLATLLEIGVSRQVKHGLYREYVPRVEDLTTLRGKINIRDSIKNRTALTRKMTCEFDELSEDNTLNQILKTTCSIAIKSSLIDKKTKGALKKSLLFFSEVSFIDPSNIPWHTISFARKNRSYRFMISVCQLLLQDMLITDATSGLALAPYISDKELSRLFEKFVLNYYRTHHQHLKPSAPNIPWALDEDYAGSMLPSMRADIALSAPTGILIIDTKFYEHTYQSHGLYNSKTVHSHNLYQIYAYVKNKAALSQDKNVAGMLLYAKTGDELHPRECFAMNGNTIYVQTLDLSQPFAEIAHQLDDIASIVPAIARP